MRTPLLVVLATSSALAAAPRAHAQPAAIAPPESVVQEGVPALPAALADDVARYTEFRSASLASWHPMRREILVQTRFADAPQIHRVRTPGGARTQLTFFPDRVGGATYPPAGAGEFFLFTKDVGGDEFAQVYRMDTAGGAITRLTDGGRSQNGGVRWARSGDRIAYASTRRNGKDRDIYVMDPREPRTDRLVLPVEGGGWGVADWSPDARRLLVTQYLSANDSRLWLVDAATGERTPLAGSEGEPAAYSGARFSLAGDAVYTATDHGSEFQRLTLIDLATGARRTLTEHVPWNVDAFELSSDGALIALVTNEDGVGTLRILDAATEKERAQPDLGLGPGVLSGLEWRPGARELAFTFTSARTPSDVYSYDVDSGRLERWTESETGGLDTSRFAAPELVRWKSFDGRTISGFLYRPPARHAGPRPVIVNIHGGPEGQARPTFLARNNYYLDELGVAMIYPNVRGSRGYGKTFLALDNGMQREDSVRDIGALLDWIATRKDLDASRVMVTGGSYGGYMTLAVATTYADRIRCALDVVGISNFISFLERTEAYRRDLRRAEYGDERDPAMRAHFEKIGPLFHAQRITKPLFVVAGRNDPRVPYQEGEQIVATVRKHGTPVWYLVANDEGHGFVKKKNQDYQFYATVAFIRDHLLRP